MDIVNNNTDRLQLLSHCPSFRSWSSERKEVLASKMRSKFYEGNTTIIRAGESVKELYIIKT
jgi:signal-transduction protein with cAMP-binding, CBS, and nucleotidyltransferase domain